MLLDISCDVQVIQSMRFNILILLVFEPSSCGQALVRVGFMYVCACRQVQRLYMRFGLNFPTHARLFPTI